MPDFLITSFGATADGRTRATAAIQQAIDMAGAAGGGRVVVPAGTYLCGSIQLRSDVELHLDAGARLLASGDYDDYAPAHRSDEISFGRVVEDELPRRAFITAFEAHRCAITGPGTIDGNGRAFVESDTGTIYVMRGPRAYLERPFTVFLIGCEGVRLDGFRLLDSAFWAIRLSGCHGALVHGLTLHTDLKTPNADGIDIDCCRDVRISACDISSGDDCISLKTCLATRHYGPVENVVISNCTFVSTSGAITLGTESMEPIRDVVVTGCTVRRSHRGFAVRPRQPAVIENVIFSDCVVETRLFDAKWWGHGEPLHVTAGAWTKAVGPGSVRNIVFRNILCRSEAGVVVWGEKPGLIEGVRFEDVRVELGKTSRWPHRVDLRPNEGNRMEVWPVSAFDVRHAADVQIRNCSVAWSETAGDGYAHAVHSVDAPGLSVEGLRGAAFRPEIEAVRRA